MHKPSGKFVLRLPPELHASLQNDARSQSLSLNELCRIRLSCLPNSVSGASGFGGELLAWVQALPAPLIGLTLFGSQAKGAATAGSDTDLLLVLEAGTPLSRDLYSVWDEHFKSLPSGLRSKSLTPHFAVFDPEVGSCGSLWLEISLSGILLWEKFPGRIEKHLIRIREAIADGRFRRMVSHGHPYWVRTEDK
jgi:hypothetical protein